MELEKSFDEHIKAALEKLEAPLRPNDWEMLEQKLDMPSAGGNSAFDAFVASQLGSLKMEGTPADWHVMQEMLEAEEAAELLENQAAIDNVAHEKLAHLSAPYRASHWELMARRLQEEFSLRHQLYKYKVAEVALMLLLLLTIIRFLPYASEFFGGHANDSQTQKMESPSNQNPARPTVPKPERPQALLQTDAKPGAAPHSAQRAEQSIRPMTGSGATASTPTLHPADIRKSPGSILPPSNHEGQISAQRNDDSGLSALSLPPAPSILFQPGNSSPGHLLPTNNQSEKPAAPAHGGLMGKADFLDLLDAQFIDTRATKALPILTIMPAPRQNEVRFSLFASSDVNYVFTPSTRLTIIDTLVKVDNDTAFALGYGGGILASFKTNRWEVQTGGVYSFRRYSPGYPKFTIETVGYYISEDFNGIQQDLLQIPLNVQYYFKNRGNWRFYGSAGASGYFITSVVYEIAIKRQPSFDPTTGPDETRTVFQEKDFPKGLFDGGSFHDNFYLTANLGLGVERYITPRWSLFFQPNYHHYLLTNGVGANNDKFYTLSFYLGTKVGLK